MDKLSCAALVLACSAAWWASPTHAQQAPRAGSDADQRLIDALIPLRTARLGLLPPACPEDVDKRWMAAAIKIAARFEVEGRRTASPEDIRCEAMRAGIDRNLAFGLVWHLSNFQQDQIAPNGAAGLLRLHPQLGFPYF